EVVAVVGVEVDARRRQTTDVGVGVDDVAAAQPQRTRGSVANDHGAGGGQVVEVAVVDGVHRTDGADQALDLDVEVVDRHVEAGDEVRLEHQADGVGFGLFRVQAGVAALQEVVLTGGAGQVAADGFTIRHL